LGYEYLGTQFSDGFFGLLHGPYKAAGTGHFFSLPRAFSKEKPICMWKHSSYHFDPEDERSMYLRNFDSNAHIHTVQRKFIAISIPHVTALAVFMRFAVLVEAMKYFT
jgi:hypothetical protein